ncbi:MAG: isoleucine--tRNA ligase [Lachnospiraceae bacterium]|nr:isoleucine--tRNA ligase [Lachnospiraceae bacterium]
MYKKVPTDQNFVGREKEVVRFWKEHEIFRKSEKVREGCPVFTFYDGPPTANGKPHIGHVETRAIKDMIPRYRTMKGFYVPRKAGWDTHGLPVELEVERELGLNGKDQIEAYGIEPFIKKCKESVWKYESMWEDFSNAVGYWADMDNPYVTYHDDYIESVWWGLKEIWKKGLLYKGFKIVPYCPRCGTPLSTAEVSQGYKTLKERSAIARFRALDDENTFYLVWTTTPWTLPSNGALCVNADETYVKVRAEKEGVNYILAEALADQVIHSRDKEETITVLERFKGSELQNRPYEPLFGFTGDYVAKKGLKGFFVCCDSYVTMSDGTGIVHLAPAFGEDDARVGRIYGVPFIQFVDGKGEMTADTPYKGLFVKAADPVILDDLRNSGKLFSAPKFEHEYPHCWRCDTPLIYYARDSWYIKETAVRDNLLKNNDTVNWFPESIGKGRFGNWLENIQDWAISRNRYWGTPLNIWECGCGHRECVGSREELFEKSGDPEAKTVELHRPYIDRITLKCPECGGVMHRVPEVVDCWFDSGAMPFAQQHYPFENQDAFKQQFPASFISEAVDQTRGWFHSLMAESTLIFDRAPYENVVVLGLVQDENGQKMSKHKGNVVDPMEVLDTIGADAIRWYFYWNSAPWLAKRFSKDAVIEGRSKFLGTLWNTYAFYTLYADIDGFDPMKYMTDGKWTPEGLTVMDRWILSKLNSLIRSVDHDLWNYRITEAARALQEFTEDLSNWYVRRGRSRYWAKGMEQDKVNAYMTLYTCLKELSLLSAPMIPFMTEEIWQNIVRTVDPEAEESIHLATYPEADESMIDPGLEASMDHVLKLVVMGRAARNVAALKNRQPLKEMIVKAPFTLEKYFDDVIADELNVKKLRFTDDVSTFTTYTFKPQLRTVGPKYGKALGAIKAHLAEMDGNAAMKDLRENGSISFDAAGTPVTLKEEDLLIDVSHKEGFVSEAEGEITVVLDTTLSQELIEEGFVREIISKVQTMRKEADFNVTDRIAIHWQAEGLLRGIFTKYAEEIAEDTLASEIGEGHGGYEKEWSLNGEPCTLGVEVTIPAGKND